MLQTIDLWLHTTPLGEFLLTMFLSMAPVAELRVGLPLGAAMGLPLPAAFIAAVIGNMLPVPFIILFVRRAFAWIRRRLPPLHSFIDRLERRAESKRELVYRYQTLGLLILVAIPLPGTGAWTGCLAAAFLDMRLKKAMPAVVLGVITAGCIMIALTHAGINLFSA